MTTIGNWTLYSLTGLNRIVKLARNAHTISTGLGEHVVLLSQRSFTLASKDTINVIRPNTTP